jgi:hypothetical protein
MTNRKIYLAAIIVLAMSGCVAAFRPRMLTANELAQRGTRVYSADVPTGMRAAAVALQTLGFEITVNDPASGTIKTAPRDMMMSASGSTVYRDELAWVVVVTADATRGIQVLATPHAYSNGTEVAPTEIPADAIEPKFATLWNELDADMKQMAAATP